MKKIFDFNQMPSIAIWQGPLMYMGYIYDEQKGKKYYVLGIKEMFDEIIYIPIKHKTLMRMIKDNINKLKIGDKVRIEAFRYYFRRGRPYFFRLEVNDEYVSSFEDYDREKWTKDYKEINY